MKLYFAIVLIAIFAVSAFAANDISAYVKDYTTEILQDTLPATFPAAKFSDFTALVTGAAPRYTDSESTVPMTDSMKRALASVTFLTADLLPSKPPQIDLVITDDSLTKAGTAIVAIHGQNPCQADDPSLFDHVYSSNEQSLVFLFASSPNFANSICSKLQEESTTHGKSLCATLTGFVGTTDDAFSKAEAESEISKAVSIEVNTNDFSRLTSEISGFTVKVTETELTIDDIVFPRSDVAIDAIIRELAYITNVSAQLATIGPLTTDDAPDYYTFVVTSTRNVENSTKLIAFIDAVIEYSADKFATQYEQSLLLTVIQANNTFDEESCASDDVDPGTIVTTEEVRSYQIVLWLVITLVFVAIGGFSATMNMHILPDSALQGGVSTYWTQKRS